MLSYVLDEQQRGPLWRAIQKHNSLGIHPIDTVRVGDPPDLPLGSLDPEILLWAEPRGRILVSEDVRTLPGHLASHLQSRRHCPGIFIIRSGQTLSRVVDFLVIAAYASQPDEWGDWIEFIP